MNQPILLVTRIAQDGLRAWVSAVRCGPGGPPPDAEALRAALAEAGVANGVIDESVEFLVDMLARGEPLDEEVLVAEVQPPTLAGRELTLPRTALLARDQARGPIPGVTGRPLTPELRLGGLSVRLGEGLGVDQTGALAAERSGFVELSGGEVRLRPLVSIAPDGLSAALDLPALLPGGSRPTADDILSALTAEGVVFGVERALIGEALAQAATTGADVRGAIVARGQPPVDGTDAAPHFRVDLTEKIGALLDDGSIDYWERQLITNVAAGQLLLEATAPEPGRPGRSVRGGTIPARDGHSLALAAGENVEVSPDGLRYFARIQGCVQFAQDRIWVADFYRVDGDVDLSTGNLDCAGLLQITGTVRSGFSVRARGDVHVLGTVEDAWVESGGHIIVRGGVLMKDVRDSAAPRLKASGSVHLGFCTNARIQAGGDIHVKGEAINSDLSANGRVALLEGNGLIIGGRARALLGIAARGAGSTAQVRTELRLELSERQQRELERLLTEQARIDRELVRVAARLNADGLFFKLQQGNDEQKLQLLKILAGVQSLKEEKRRCLDQTKAIESQRQASLRGTVKLHGTVHPGVEIVLHGRAQRLEHTARAYNFHLSIEDDKLVRTALRADEAPVAEDPHV